MVVGMGVGGSWLLVWSWYSVLVDGDEDVDVVAIV